MFHTLLSPTRADIWTDNKIPDCRCRHLVISIKSPGKLAKLGTRFGVSVILSLFLTSLGGLLLLLLSASSLALRVGFADLKIQRSARR